MVSAIRRFCVPIIAILIGGGLEVSGFEDMRIAIILWSVAGIWGAIALFTWKPTHNVWAKIKRFRITMHRREPLVLIDSFPKDNEAITTEDVKKIFLKFNKPIDGKTVGYISNYYIKRNSRCQWNTCGWIEFSENDTKLIWHVHESLLQNKDEYGPMDIDYPTFEIRIGLPPKDWKLKAIDGNKLPVTEIRVKIKPEVSPSQTNGIQPIVISDGQKIEVKPITGKREADYERTEHTMWAELAVKNIGKVQLNDVEVNILSCLSIMEKQDALKENEFVMFDQLRLKPFCIYWSERQTTPKQMRLTIPAGGTRSVIVAFQDNPNGGNFNFNTPLYHWVVGGAKIEVEVSSTDSVLWQDAYYIECHGNILGGERAKFEFVEWDKWMANRNITLLDSDKEGPQTE